MQFSRGIAAAAMVSSVLALAACSFGRSPPPAPVIRPATFTALGLSAAYLSGDVVAGRRARAAKMKAAGVRPLSATAVPTYMTTLEAELRRQTAGIGLDVVHLADGILIRIPAAFTFDAGSSAVKPQFDATLLEIARTVKSSKQTYVDVLAHTDTTGTPQVNQALSDKRATAVAGFLAKHGVGRARIASKGYGESAPLYNPDVTEMERAANRRVEIRLVPYRG